MPEKLGEYLRLRKRKIILLNLCLLLILLSFFYFSLVLGPRFHAFKLLFRLIAGGEVDPILIKIILTQRLPRTIAAILVGASLALAGLYFQIITRNPLADPYLIGVSAGALLTLSISYKLGIISSAYIITLIAFLGALLGFSLTLLISKVTGFHSLSLILGGLGVTFLLNSISIFILLTTLDYSKVFMLFFGTLATVSWEVNYLMIIFTVFALIYGFYLYKGLNAIMVSDENAETLGYRPNVLRLITTVISALIASVTVSWFGLIGFVGLATPHIVRLMLRTSNVVIILPTVVLLGALVLVISDLASRVLMPPIEIPLNAITSLIGAPILIYLIIKGVRHGVGGY